jgi:hypothetical protein
MHREGEELCVTVCVADRAGALGRGRRPFGVALPPKDQTQAGERNATPE